MEESVLKSTKKILGIHEDYDAFDLDVITHINAAFSVLDQIGVTSIIPMYIENSTRKWSDFIEDQKILNLVKTYVYLKVRVLFDPPGTSFLINSMDEQIKQAEWRLQVMSEGAVS